MWWSGSEARGTNEAPPRAQCLPGRVESEASRLGRRRRRALFIVEDAGAARDDVYIYTCGERWTWGLFWSGSLRNPEVPTLRQCEAGWCSDVTAPERKDMVIVSPLVSPGTTLDEPMAHEDNTDEQRACGRTSVEVIPGAMMAALALAWLPVPTERRRNRDSEFLPLHCSV